MIVLSSYLKSARKCRTILLFAATILAAPVQASAQAPEPVEEFYRGKQIKLILGHDVGGDYDIGGRLLARYLGRHIPGNPSVIVQNMPGANSLVATNYLYNVAPKDGTVVGSFSRNVPGDAVRGLRNLKADPRQFGWVGATSRPSRICIARADSKINGVPDLMERELIVGGTGTAGVQSFIPNVINRVIGTKFKVVEGYKGYSDLTIALERGGINGLCHLLDILLASHGEVIKVGQYRVLFHVEESALAELPAVESIFNHVKEERHRQVLRLLFSSADFGRPYAVPPGVPEERLRALRAAFEATVRDPEFLAEAQRLKLDVTPVSGQALQELVNKLHATPKDVIEASNEILPPQR